MAIYLGTNQVSYTGTNGGYMLNGRLITTKEYELKLSDTNFSSLTVSTTAQSLTLPATDYSSSGTSVTCFRLGNDYDGTPIDLYNHDYIVLFEAITTYNYSSSISGTIHGIRNVYTAAQSEGRYYNTLNSTTGQRNTSGDPTTGSSASVTRALLLYQKADNTYAIYTTAYGIYCAPTPAFTTNSNGGYINLNLSSVSVRGNDSYFPVSAINALNTTTTKINCKWYVYEGDKSLYGQVYDRAYELTCN